jgi:hypothetical protein
VTLRTNTNIQPQSVLLAMRLFFGRVHDERPVHVGARHLSKTGSLAAVAFHFSGSR